MEDFWEIILKPIIGLIKVTFEGLWNLLTELYSTIKGAIYTTLTIAVLALGIWGYCYYNNGMDDESNANDDLVIDLDYTQFGIVESEIINNFKKDPLSYRTAVPNHIRKRFMMITPEQETAMGNHILQILKDRKVFWNNKKQQKRCNRILKKLKDTAPDLFQSVDEIYLLDKDFVNAFAYIGGKIFVTRGLLEHVEDDNILAFVIAHELGHTVARHSSEMISKTFLQKIPVNFILDKDDSLLTVAGTYITLNLISLKYSRTMEFEADRLAVLFTTRAGFDAKKAIDFFADFDQQEMESWQELLSTHPPDKKRIAEIENTIKYLQNSTKEPNWGGLKALAIEKGKVEAIKLYMKSKAEKNNE